MSNEQIMTVNSPPHQMSYKVLMVLTILQSRGKTQMREDSVIFCQNHVVCKDLSMKRPVS